MKIFIITSNDLSVDEITKALTQNTIRGFVVSEVVSGEDDLKENNE